MIMADEEEARERLQQMKRLGVRISVEDFGTGYSSLGHLERFPVDELKIDKSFVAGIGAGSEGSGVAAATIRLARSLRIEVVAEGIETEGQLAELCRLSCARGQGYYFWRPINAQAAGAVLNEKYSVLPPAVPDRVLIVDDDDALRSSTARLLSQAGFETLQAASGLEALELARSTRLDAAIVDVGLPDKDGLTLGRELKELYRSTALIYLSGSAVGLAQRVLGLDLGGDAYLTKPVAPEELIATIRAVLRGRSEVRA
jgi:CheY-like chemotaxis protein